MNWYDVLQGVRRIAKRQRGPFTSADLAGERVLDHYKEEKRSFIASAWLGKFAKWGYVKRTGALTPPHGGRWIRQYEITEWGIEFKPSKKRRK